MSHDSWSQALGEGMAAKKEEDLKLEVRLLQNGDELVEQTEKKLKSTLRENLLTILIFVGVTFGVGKSNDS